MNIRDDFSQQEVITLADYHWTQSLSPGVERMMLDRIGDEVARATSIVRYQPNTCFKAHTHGGGEEILVLKGVFADEYGSYPAGSYLRNPIGTAHTPKIGNEGATIFVKLHQFIQGDNEQKNINIHQVEWLPGLVEGLSVLPLHNYLTENVALVKWAPNTRFQSHQHWGGEEILVLEGTFFDEQGAYPKGSWIRNPHLSRHNPFTKDDGAVIFVKTGHLPDCQK